MPKRKPTDKPITLSKRSKGGARERKQTKQEVKQKIRGTRATEKVVQSRTVVEIPAEAKQPRESGEAIPQAPPQPILDPGAQAVYDQVYQQTLFDQALSFRRADDDQNLLAAAGLFQQLVEKNYAPAQYELAAFYFLGKGGVDRNLETAVYLYRQAALQNHVEAMVDLGICYEGGWGVTVNIELALSWYWKAANLGSGRAYYSLGRCSEALDPEQAITHYKQAVTLGYTPAPSNLGNLYKRAGDSYEQDTDYLIDVSETTPADPGRLAILQKVMGYYREAAALGEPQAKERCRFLTCKEAAERMKTKEAYYNLACCYLEGIGVEEDLQEAIVHLREAADKGYIPALLTLARGHKAGWDGRRAPNIAVAMSYYQEAAKLGDAKSQAILNEPAGESKTEVALSVEKGGDITRGIHHALPLKPDTPGVSNNLSAFFSTSADRSTSSSSSSVAPGVAAAVTQSSSNSSSSSSNPTSLDF